MPSYEQLIKHNFLYERFYFVYAYTKFVSMGNLYCLRNMPLPFQPTSFCIYVIEIPIFLALLVDVLRTEFVVNIVMPNPASIRNWILLWVVN